MADERPEYTEEQRDKISAGMKNFLNPKFKYPPNFVCARCNRFFPDNKDTKLIFTAENGQSYFVCPNCKKILNGMKESQRASNVYSGTEPSNVPKPTQQSTGSGDTSAGGGDNKEETKKNVEEPKKYICKDCGEEFNSSQELYYHKQTGCTFKGKLKGEVKKQTIGRVAGAGKSAVNTFAEGIKFTIATVLFFVITLNWFIPLVQSWTGIVIIPPSTLYEFVAKNLLVLTAICTVVSAVLAFLLGWIGSISLKGFYNAELIIVTLEVLVVLSNSWFLPWICGANPEFCSNTKCRIAWLRQGYGWEDATTMCQAGGQQVDVIKENQKWQTLDLKPQPMAKPTKEEGLTLKTLLVNKNDVGSKYTINVTKVKTALSSKQDFSENVILMASPDSPFPPYSIQPTPSDCETCGQDIEVTFNKIDKLIDSCDGYLYSNQTVETQQDGGGSSKIRLIEKNTNEIFKPTATSNPGPMDIYAYTYPYLLVYEKLINPQINPDGTFKIWVTAKLSCSEIGTYGKGSLSHIKLIYPTQSIPIESIKCPVATVKSCKEQYEGKNCIIIEKKMTLECNQYSSDEVVNEIKCIASLKKGDFHGDKTDFLSVSAPYTFEQTFDLPQIGADCKSTTTA